MHEITDRDGLFTVRKAAWHGLGEVLPEHPSKDQAQKIAHPWEPVTEPVFRRIPVIEPVTGDLGYEYEEITSHKAVVRSDDHGTEQPLGVVSDTYEPVRNEEMYDIAEVIEGEASGSVMYETGGSLKGGRKVWLLLRLRDPLVIDKDPNGAVIPYFALQNAHDGSGSFRGQATMTRIVCDNTAQMADLDAKQRGTEFTFRHTVNVRDRIEEAKMALSGWRESVQSYRLMMEHLRGVEVTAEERKMFVEEFFPRPMAKVASERVENNIEQARNTYLDILTGETCEGISNTAYGLVQASVEYLNHGRRAHSQASRFRRSYLSRDRLVTDAVGLVRSVCGV